MNPLSTITDSLSSLNLNISVASVLFFVKIVLVVLAVNVGLYAFNFVRKIFFPSKYLFETPSTLHRFSHFVVNCLKLAIAALLVYLNINIVIAAIVTFIAACMLQTVLEPAINAWHDNHQTPHTH